MNGRDADGLRRSAVGLLVVALLLVTGCDREPPRPPLTDAEATARTVFAHHRHAAAITARLLVRIKPPQGDVLILSVNLWSPADGRIRISASKVGVSGLEALLLPDGTFVGIPRDGEVVRDDLDQALADDLGAGAQIARWIEWLKFGPLPVGDTFTATSDSLTTTDPASGLPCRAVLIGNEISTLTWTRPDGQDALTISCSRYQNFDSLRRPAVYTLVIPGWDGECLVRLQELDVVPTISEERLRLEPPAEAKAIDLAGFLAQVVE